MMPKSAQRRLALARPGQGPSDEASLNVDEHAPGGPADLIR
jgi:hypothetical protein